MTRIPEPIRNSVTLRMALGLAVMLIPLVILGIESLFTSQGMIEALEEVARTEATELRPVMDLQKYVLQAAMPPNDYIILGMMPSGASSISWRARSTVGSRTCSSPAFDEQNERKHVESAAAEWEKARAVGMEILAIAHPGGSAAGASRMKVFDAHIAGPLTS